MINILGVIRRKKIKCRLNKLIKTIFIIEIISISIKTFYKSNVIFLFRL